MGLRFNLFDTSHVHAVQNTSYIHTILRFRDMNKLIAHLFQKDKLQCHVDSPYRMRRDVSILTGRIYQAALRPVLLPFQGCFARLLFHVMTHMKNSNDAPVSAH